MAKRTDTRSKLKQLILYVAAKMQDAEFFGAAKLNKVLYRAEMATYSELGTVLTGFKYQKNNYGPTLRAYTPLVEEMRQEGLIDCVLRQMGTFTEQRLIPKIEPDLSFFSKGELRLVDREIERAWDVTGSQISDEEHQTAAWFATQRGETIQPGLFFVEDPENMPPLSHEEEERARKAIERFRARTAAAAGDRL